ncbi:MAG: VOC family protein [Segetibacter sp.]|nr:VOC family protein [Segetibacter sp.]
MNKTFFAPQLYIKSGVTNIEFYTKAFDAIELRRWTNDDGSIHVAELSIDGALFHLHEESLKSGSFSPERYNGTTTTIGLFVPDVDFIMNRAIAAGGIVTSPAQDYDYGYRQGEIEDPFGHIWMIEMKK